MKKINIIKENRDFNRIISNFKPIHFKHFIIYLEKKDNQVYKFGISVSKKIGNAVVRNKIKRQLKNIIVQKLYKNNFNCIIIVKKNILNLSFDEMRKEIFDIIKNIGIYKGEKDEK